MTLKYEITGIQHPNYPNLFRIQALRDIPSIGVKADDLGGYVEHERNLSQNGNCWIGGDACVYENASVCGVSRVCGYAWVFGEACIYDNAHIYGAAWIGASAAVFGKAQVYGNAKVYGTSRIYDHASISGSSTIHNALEINAYMKISDCAYITSQTQIYYADEVTAYFNKNKELIVKGHSPDIEYHTMLARLKLL